MSLIAETPTDASTPELSTASPVNSPTSATESATPAANVSPIHSLQRRALIYQAGFGLLIIAVLLAGIGIAYTTRSATQGVGTIEFCGRSVSASLPVGLALAGSVALLAVGLLVTRRCLRPVSDLERQLHRLAFSTVLSAEDMEPAPGATPLEAGWNRIIQHLHATDQAQSMHERLETAVSDYRERKGERVLNALTDGIAVTDETQRIIRANNALYSILNLEHTGECLSGTLIEEALARKAGKAPAEGVLDAGHRGHRVVAEITCPSDDSSAVLRVCRTPLATVGDSNQAGYVWSVRDVTQQKLADRMRDQFVNAATHELRTPMANIKAYAETLALGEVDDVEQQKMFCNVINDEVTRLARFIDDLLHLSRMEVGATTLQLQVTDMGRLLEEVAKKVQPQMTQKNLDFTVALPAKLPELIVDKDKIAVAVINLLGNAAKYTPEGGRIGLRVVLLENSMQIDVEDTGIGIAEEELPKVLDKFYRSSDPRVHDEIGSGLGLSLAQEIIRLHGGKLSVSSEINKGSKFTIILPTTAE